MDNSTRAGTAGGTFLAFIANLGKDDILKTMVLTMIGAVVSFVVSIGLQCIVGRIRKKRRDRTPG
jgi:mannitol-specific phosphotransferase system IIBC component